MILQRSNTETTQTTSQKDWTDAVEPTTESEQASTQSEATQNPLQKAWNWLGRNKDALMALGVTVSLAGNAYNLWR